MSKIPTSLMTARDRPFIIAEAGTCHASPLVDERLSRALTYVEYAAYCGADAVKFQWFDDPTPETMFCWIEGDDIRAPRWRESAMSLEAWAAVKARADENNIHLLASCFEHSTVAWLNELELCATKVASRATAAFPYADAPAPYFVSNGMHKEPPIEGDAVFVLQCEANYPSTTWWQGTHPGFSDHSGTPWRALNATVRGCRIIELHFYVYRSHAGPDLPASLTIENLKLVCAARDGLTGGPT